MPKLHISSGQLAFTCSAVLFDLDGVLIDSTPAVERVWRVWADKRGLDYDHVIRNAHGRRTIDTVRSVAPHLQAEEESDIIESMEILDTEGILAVPGTRELLRDMPSGRFTIVTSASRALAQARLQFAGLPIPAHFVTSDDVVHGKPHPEPYLKGAELLGVKARDVLVFEDSPAGIAAAKEAGMLAIALTTSAPLEELQCADAIIDSFKDFHVSFDGHLLTLAN